MKKNDSIELVIEDMGTDGEGIGHVATEDGRSIAVFVKDAVMGDTIRAAITKVKKQYVYARLVEVIKPSPYRVEPKCPVARPCGGCTLQHVSYEKQLEVLPVIDKEFVKANLSPGGSADLLALTYLLYEIYHTTILF